MLIFNQYNVIKKHFAKKCEYFKKNRIFAKSTLNDNIFIEFIEIIVKFIIKFMIKR